MEKQEVKLEKYEHVHFRFNTRVVNPKSVMASVLRLTPSKTWNYDQFVSVSEDVEYFVRTTQLPFNAARNLHFKVNRG